MLHDRYYLIHQSVHKLLHTFWSNRCYLVRSLTICKRVEAKVNDEKKPIGCKSLRYVLIA